MTTKVVILFNRILGNGSKGCHKIVLKVINAVKTKFNLVINFNIKTNI